MADLTTSQSLWDRARRMREEEELARAAGVEGPSALVPPPVPPEPEPSGAAPDEAAAPDPTKPAMDAPDEATYEPSPPDLPDPEQEPAGFDASSLDPAGDDQGDVWARYAKTRRPPEELGPPPGARAPSMAFPIAGMIVDGLTNRGRGIGGILADMSKAPDTDYENWVRRAKAAQAQQGLESDFAQSIRPSSKGLTPEQLELQRLRLAQAGERLQLGRGKEERLQEAHEYRYNPEKADDVRAFLATRGMDVAPLKDMSLDDMKAVSPEIKQAVEVAQADITNAIAADKARGVAQATMQPKIDTAKGISDATQENKLELVREAGQIRNANELAKKQAERADAAKHPIRGFIIEDDDSYGVAASDQVTRRNMELSAGAYRSLMESLDRMESLRAQHGAELPGEVQGEYETAKTTAIGAITVLGQTGVLNDGEYQRYSKMIPGIDPSLGDALLVFDKDIKGDQIRGVKRALRGTVDAKLYQWGARYDYDSLGSKPQKKGKKAAPRGGDDDGMPAGDATAAAPTTKANFRNGKEVKAVRKLKPELGGGRVIFYTDGTKEHVP